MLFAARWPPPFLPNEPWRVRTLHCAAAFGAGVVQSIGLGRCLPCNPNGVSRLTGASGVGVGGEVDGMELLGVWNWLCTVGLPLLEVVGHRILLR